MGTIKRSNLKEWHELSKFRFNLEGDEGNRGRESVRVSPDKRVSTGGSRNWSQPKSS